MQSLDIINGRTETYGKIVLTTRQYSLQESDFLQDSNSLQESDSLQDSSTLQESDSLQDSIHVMTEIYIL